MAGYAAMLTEAEARMAAFVEATTVQIAELDARMASIGGGGAADAAAMAGAAEAGAVGGTGAAAAAAEQEAAAAQMAAAEAAAATAAEEAAAKEIAANEAVAAATAELTASVEAEVLRLNTSVESVAATADKAAVDYAAAMEAMRAETAKVATEMEAADARAAKSITALAAKTDESAVANAAATDGAVARLGKVGIGVALAAVAVGAGTVKMAADFESSTNRLVTSAGETHDNLGLVRDGILAMAGSVGYSAEELSKAMYTVESGGQHGADGLKVLQAAAQGAKAENADLVKVTDAVTSVLQDYHLKAEDSALVTSKLVAAVGAGKSTFEEFTGALHSVLPVASASHISLNDILGDLASMTIHGMSADQASQNLAHTIQHLQTTTQGQRDMLGELGLSAQDLSSKLGERGLSGTLQLIEKTISDHMGPAGKIVVNAFNDSKDAAQALQQMMDKMPASVKNVAQEYLKGSVSAGDLTKAIKGLPPEMANLGKQFETTANRATGFSTMLKQGNPDALAFADALKRATGDSTTLNTALMLTGENADTTNTAIRAVAGAATEADGSVKGWSDVQSTFNQKFSEFKGTLESLAIKIGTAVLPKLKDFLDSINTIVSNKDTMDAFAKGVSNALQLIINAVTSVGMGFNALQDIMHGITSGNTDQAQQGFRELGDAFKNLGSNMTDASKAGADAVNSLNGTMTSAADFNKEFAASIGDTYTKHLSDAIRSGISGTTAAATALTQSIQQVFSEQHWTTAGMKTTRDFSEGMKNAVGDALDAATKVTGDVGDSFRLFDPTPAGRAIADKFGSGILTGRQAVDAAGDEVVSRLVATMNGATPPAGTAGSAAGNSYATGIANTLPQVQSSAGKLANSGTGPLWGVIPAAGTAGAAVGNNYAGGIANSVPTVSATAGQLANTGVGPLWGVVGSAFASGSSVGANFARGISAQVLNVELAANNLAGAMSNRLPHSPAKEGPLSGKGSPELAGATVGRMVATGLMSQQATVAAAMSSMVGAVPLSSSTGMSLNPAFASGGGAGSRNGGAQPIVFQLTVQGNLVHQGDLRRYIQDIVLQHAGRNVGNGLGQGTAVQF
jgi:hypothetical protein